MSEFKVQEEEPRYILDGRKLWSVTEILKAEGFIADFHNEEAMLRGKIVHRACCLLAKGTLDWATVDPRIMGYVMSYQEFLNHTKWGVRATEVSLYDSDLLFAGTFDVDFACDWLFDLKTGARERWHQLQTAAYLHLKGGKGKRGALYLKNDGSMPTLEEHTDRNDWKVFLSALNIKKWKENT